MDEIDKAPRDFPNDLLQELSDQRFQHPFDGTEVRNQGPPPILVITSNGERVMPDPFLRRCICCHIELDETLLREILQAWHDDFADGLQPGVEAKVIPGLVEVRRRTKDQGRAPSIAELLVWLNVLAVHRVPAARIDVERPAILPGIECLIKMHEDYGLLV